MSAYKKSETCGSRWSRQRELIMTVLKGTKSHPTADWVYQEVRKSLPNISLGTVYRNLKLLKEKGDILELNYGDGQRRFDGNPENHYHFNCQHCGKVYDVDGPLADEMAVDQVKRMGFEITHHRVEFYGLCRDCRHEEETHFMRSNTHVAFMEVCQ